MEKMLKENEVKKFGISADLLAKINHFLQSLSAEEAWKKISTTLLGPHLPFDFHLQVFSRCYPHFREQPYQAAAWIPDDNSIKDTHLAEWMREKKCTSLTEFHQWTIKNRSQFWEDVTKKLGIIFSQPAETICELNQGKEHPRWFSKAKLNIVESCFNAHPDKIAIIFQRKSGAIQKMTYGELDRLSNRIANSLIQQGFTAGDAIAISMPMNLYAVAIYLGIIKLGGVVISIADSFSPDEIAARLRIAQAKGIFTQDIILRDQKKIPLYEKIIAAKAPRAIVLAAEATLSCALRINDLEWKDFLIEDEQFQAKPCDPHSYCNILFSSGTTGDPKAIPWTHTTPIKVAADAYFHHDLQPQDIVAWPTNLGWMMGPWLIFASLINGAAIALYDDVPRGREFGQFVQDTGVTILGVVPTLVASWRQSHCFEGLDFQHIKCYSSTGECSNPEDMFYLMSLAGYKPVIEYCGGTEIGGAYISSTLVEKNYPAVFTTPAMGLDFKILDEHGQCADAGEVALIPPSIGLSNELLNADHHKIYFADMPRLPDGSLLRRHGDQLQHFPEGGYCILGRADDTMNLGGIKVSSAEIERALVGIENIIETAAIALPSSEYGPSQLIIYAATAHDLDREIIKKVMQSRINQSLNPLFKIHDVIFIRELPKTASNKIMRRMLRHR